MQEELNKEIIEIDQDQDHNRCKNKEIIIKEDLLI
jgi:hypothetical protein